MEYVVLGINPAKKAKVVGRVKAPNYDKAKSFAKEKWEKPGLDIVVTDEVLRIRRK